MGILALTGMVTKPMLFAAEGYVEVIGAGGTGLLLVLGSLIYRGLSLQGRATARLVRQQQEELDHCIRWREYHRADAEYWMSVAFGIDPLPARPAPPHPSYPTPPQGSPTGGMP